MSEHSGYRSVAHQLSETQEALLHSKEIEQELQDRIAQLTTELEAARALLAHREGIWQEAIAKRDRNLEAARASFKGACDESAKTLEQLDAARRDIGRLRDACVEDHGDGITKCLLCLNFVTFPNISGGGITIGHEADCPLANTAQPASATNESDVRALARCSACGHGAESHQCASGRFLPGDDPCFCSGFVAAAQQQPRPEAGGQDREGVGEPREL